MENGLTKEEFIRYSRHLLIPEVGLKGQEKLKSSAALIIGTGGLGSPVSLYLAAAGVGKIGIVDYDSVETSNLQRQVIHGSESIGKSKVFSAQKRMLELNPDIQVNAYEERFSSENALRIAKDYDILIDGSDNFPTRYLTNDLCVLLGIPNVYGSVYRFDGQVSVFYAKEGPCYRCLFPEPPPPELVPSCAEGGILGILPGTIGTIQATEAIKLLLGIGSNLIGRLLLYDALEMTFDTVKLKKNPNCRICSTEPEIKHLIDYEKFCNNSVNDNSAKYGQWDISPLELKLLLDQGKNIQLLDVREPHELDISSIKKAKLIPLGQLAGRISELDLTQEIIIFCKTGSRSRRALDILKSAGIKRVRLLKGGINEWAKIIDPSLPVY
jgi:molybdopterin/thiamine biosynthesis adenylyltransferase/rhodanese-related sulfurtransferase